MEQQETPGDPKSPRRPQEAPGQEDPGGPRRHQEAPRGPRKSQRARQETRKSSQEATRADRWVAHAQPPRLRIKTKVSENRIVDAKTSL